METYKQIYRRVFKKWYCGYFGITIFDRKVLGFSISDNTCVVDLKTLETKRSVDLYIYVPFYCFMFEIINK